MPRRCRGIRGDEGIAPYGREQGVRSQNGGRGRTPPLYTKYRTAQLCISEQKRQRKEKQRQCNI